MTDDAKAGAGPEMPEELWGYCHPSLGMCGIHDEGGSPVYASLADLERDGDSLWVPTVVGVHPRYRNAIEAIGEMLRLAASRGVDLDIGKLVSIVARAKGGQE